MSGTETLWQELICRLEGVQAAQVVFAENGMPCEIHVLAGPEKSSKSLVRDIQSALTAQLASVDAVTLAGQGIVVTQVYSLRDGQRLLGSAFLNEDPDNAAVHSVLSAVNRRLSVLPRTAG